jgi:hypothetical protein
MKERHHGRHGPLEFVRDNHADHERRELAAATAAFLAQLPTQPPKLAPGICRWLVALADLVTRARSPVLRDGYRGILLSALAPEVPARLALQLHALLQGLVLVAGGGVVMTAELRRVARVAWDCIPVLRREVLRLLAQVPGPVTLPAIAGAVQHPPNTVRRTLEDLQALKLVTCGKGGAGKADRWQLRERWRAMLLEALRTLGLIAWPGRRL